jgi:hypothetical protein
VTKSPVRHKLCRVLLTNVLDQDEPFTMFPSIFRISARAKLKLYPSSFTRSIPTCNIKIFSQTGQTSSVKCLVVNVRPGLLRSNGKSTSASLPSNHFVVCKGTERFTYLTCLFAGNDTRALIELLQRNCRAGCVIRTCTA